MARSAFRSVSYDLEASVAVAEVAVRAGGSVAPDDLAAALGYSGVRNGAFLARLASARCFGLVSARTATVVPTKRGRVVLSSDAASAGQARVEAVLAVPLFRAVLHDLGDRPVPTVDGLADLLVERFGEVPARAPAVAAKLAASVAQAGGEAAVRTVLRTQMTRPIVEFTEITDDGGLGRPRLLGWLPARRDQRRSSPVAPDGRPAGGRAGEAVMGGGRQRHGRSGGSEAPVYLDDEPARPARARGTVALRTAAAVVVVAAVAVPAGLLATSSATRVATPPTSTSTSSPGGSPAAVHAVLGALSATTASGSFDMSYRLSETAPPGSSATTATTCIPLRSVPVARTGGSLGGSSSRGVMLGAPPPTTCVRSGTASLTSVTGHGVIDVHPYAMVATAQLASGTPGSSPTAGLSVSVRVDPTTVWELSGGDGGLAPTPADNRATSGSTLSQFSGLVETSLGRREGPVAVLAMASPSGYLDLAQNEVTASDQVGTGTVGGQAVTTYSVPITPAQEASLPGTSTEQQAAIQLALKQLAALGYTGTTDLVSVGSSGYILESRATAHFRDGASVTLATTFTDFGCAGTVLMPGQQGSDVPPAGCTSPVVPVPSSTTTTDSAPTTSTTVSSTRPVGHVATTTPPSSTATTPVPSSTSGTPTGSSASG